MGLGGPELGQAATKPMTRVASKPVIFEGHQGEAAVKIQDKVLTIGPGEVTKGKGWVWEPYRDKINAVALEGNVRVVGDASGMFKNLKRGGQLKLQGLDMSQATSLADCFKNLNMESLDLYGWQTGEVTDFSGMFAGAKLRKFPHWVDAFDTTKATTMANMFRDIEILKENVLDLNEWKTQNVTNMRGMFADSYGLGIIEIQDWDMRHVTDCREFATWKTPDKRRIQGFMFGPNVRFDGAMGTTVLPISRGYSHLWHQLTPQDKGNFRDCEVSYPAVALQKRYTGQAPMGAQMYTLDFVSVRVSGHDEKVYDGEPAEINGDKYRVNLVHDRQFGSELPPFLEPSDQELTFGKGGDEAPTEPGTYPVTLSESGLNAIIDMLEPFESNSETYRAGANPLFFGTYTILPADATAKLGQVRVVHQTTNGQVLKKMTLTGKVGSDYAVSEQTFEGYHFQDVQGAATGTFTADDQTVTYLYAADENDVAAETPQSGGEEQAPPENSTGEPQAPEQPTAPSEGNQSENQAPTAPDGGETATPPNNGSESGTTPEVPVKPDQGQSEQPTPTVPDTTPNGGVATPQPGPGTANTPMPGTPTQSTSENQGTGKPQPSLPPVGSENSDVTTPSVLQKPLNHVQALDGGQVPQSVHPGLPQSMGMPLSSQVARPTQLSPGLTGATVLPTSEKRPAASVLPQTDQQNEAGLVWLGIGGLVGGALSWKRLKRRNLNR